MDEPRDEPIPTESTASNQADGHAQDEPEAPADAGDETQGSER